MRDSVGALHSASHKAVAIRIRQTSLERPAAFKGDVDPVADTDFDT